MTPTPSCLMTCLSLCDDHLMMLLAQSIDLMFFISGNEGYSELPFSAWVKTHKNIVFLLPYLSIFFKRFNVSLCSLQFAQSSFTTGLGAWGTGVAGALGIFWLVTASTVCRIDLCSGNINHFWVCGVFRWQSQEDLGFLGPRSFLVS